MKDKAKHHLDLRHSIPPIALLMVKKAIRHIAPGETLEVWIGDPETRRDLFRVLSDTACEVLRLEEPEGEGSFYRIRLRKKEAWPPRPSKVQKRQKSKTA